MSIEHGWYVARGNKRLGPFAKNYIKNKFLENKILLSDKIWHKNLGKDWVDFADYKHIFVPTNEITGNKNLNKVFELDANHIRKVLIVLTALGFLSSYLPWKSMGIFSQNAFQIVNGWFFVTPFILSAVWTYLNWNNNNRFPALLSAYSAIMLVALIGSFTDLNVTLPDFKRTDFGLSFSEKTYNTASIGYYGTAFGLFGLTLAFFAKSKQQ